jgi:hypothetical protein
MVQFHKDATGILGDNSHDAMQVPVRGNRFSVRPLSSIISGGALGTHVFRIPFGVINSLPPTRQPHLKSSHVHFRESNTAETANSRCPVSLRSDQ